MAFRLRFRGVRGSIAVPSPDHVRYGGNTSCIEVALGDHRLVLDAGTGIRELGQDLLRENVRDVNILLTHTHWDHIGINQDLGKRGLLAGMAVFGPARKAADVPGLTHPVDDGDTARVGEVVADVWLTEGHIDGHVSYVLDGAVLCGDTLFAGGCGYLFDGPPAKMYASLLRLASGSVVGRGKSSMLLTEKPPASSRP